MCPDPPIQWRLSTQLSFGAEIPLRASRVAVPNTFRVSQRRPNGRMSRAGAWAGEPMPRRLVCIGNHLGFWPQGFFPSGEADSLAISPTLAPLAAHREQFTIFSHLDHAVGGGHSAVHAFLSGVKKSESAGFGEKNVSLDQIDELLSVLSVSTKRRS